MALVEAEVRRRLELREASLSPHASKSFASRGRPRPEDPSTLRTEFQRDRDRVLHTNAFRRLMHKTQVFIAPLGDHYTTRLTHTMEVMQLARSITRALNLNEDLAEAIALAHDLGHTPFGHLGEQVLAELVPGGFRHNRQSVRILDVLENRGQGLNVTWEVRQGVLRHSKGREDIVGKPSPDLDTLEAQAVKIADALAYINHDLTDALRAGLLAETDIPRECAEALGATHSQRAATFVTDIVEHSWAATGLAPGTSGGPPAITMSPAVHAAANRVRDFLFERVYLPLGRTPQAERARSILRLLFEHLVQNPQKIPVEYAGREESAERLVADYISGMTDRYALLAAEQVHPGIMEGMETRVPLPV